MCSFKKLRQNQGTESSNAQGTSGDLYVSKSINRPSMNSLIKPKLPMSEAPSAIVELMTVALFHHSLIEFAHFTDSLSEQLKESSHVRNELRRLKWDTSNDKKQLKLTETSYSTYFGFSEMESKSIYGLADTVNYGGYTKKFAKRKTTHQCETFSETSYLASPQKKLHSYWNACDSTGKPIYVEESRKNMNYTEALFNEYAKISFICVSPNNQNEHHGSTSEFKNVIEHVKKINGDLLSKEDIVKCGCAEFVQFYEKNKFDFESLVKISGKKQTAPLNLNFDFENFHAR